MTITNKQRDREGWRIHDLSMLYALILKKGFRVQTIDQRLNGKHSYRIVLSHPGRDVGAFDGAIIHLFPTPKGMYHDDNR